MADGTYTMASFEQRRLSSITSIMKNVQIYPTREIDVSEFVNEFKQCVLSMLSTAYTT
ncbi:MAG: hypothetical protein ACJ71H_03110 [Nitrososphaeraceae archaeon]|jgi:hypothetical protein